MGKEQIMKNQYLTVENIYNMKNDIYCMELSGDCSEISAPGQFINIKIEGFYLRRPISIFDYDKEHISIAFKAVGPGTQKLAKTKPGETLDVLMPLGNGFDISNCGHEPLLVSGGIGFPPIYSLAKVMTEKGISLKVICGFNTAGDIPSMTMFSEMDIKPVITTVDGTAGIKGMVTDAMTSEKFDYVYACGPEPMLKAVYENAPDGQFSFEARMACGFGACMGCSCKTKYGFKRICKDGPVLYKEEIIW